MSDKKNLQEISPALKLAYRVKSRAAIKELQPHANKGEYKDLAKNLINKRKAGIAKSMGEEAVDMGANYVNKTPKTPQEKFKSGLKKAGYDPDAGAKRLLDLIAKQKAERAEHDKKYGHLYGEEVEGMSKVKTSRTWAMIADHEKRAKATTNDIKKQHHMNMAKQLRDTLPTNEEVESVEEGLVDFVKGVKRKVAGKEDPTDVLDRYARTARREIGDANKYNNPAASADSDKAIKRYSKVSKLLNKEEVDTPVIGMDKAKTVSIIKKKPPVLGGGNPGPETRQTPDTTSHSAGVHRFAKEDVDISEAMDPEHPIAKEYQAMKKHDIGTLRGMIKGQQKIVDASGYRSKDHAISAYLRHKHGDKKVAAAMGLKEDVDLDEAAMHRVNVTVSDPNHTMATKRNEKIQKIVRVKALDKDNALHKANQYYKDRGYRVHGAEHIGTINEDLDQINESANRFIQKVNQAANAAASGNHKNAQMHLDNARTFMMGVKSTDMGKIKDAHATYKNLRSKYAGTGGNFTPKDDQVGVAKVTKEAIQFKNSANPTGHTFGSGAVIKDPLKKKAAEKTSPSADVDPDWEKEQAEKRKMRKEDTNLDELNLNTLSSYARKAEKSASAMGKQSQTHSDNAQRHDSISKMSRTMGNNRSANKHAKSADTEITKRDNMVAKMHQRLANVDKANNKFAAKLASESMTPQEFDRHMAKLRAQKELEKTDPMRAMVNKMKSDDEYKEKLKKKPQVDNDRLITDPFHHSQSARIGEAWNMGSRNPQRGIKVGNKVRSYDFPGMHDDHYVEGHVVGETPSSYHLRVNKVVRAGKEVPIPAHMVHVEAPKGTGMFNQAYAVHKILDKQNQVAATPDPATGAEKTFRRIRGK